MDLASGDNSNPRAQLNSLTFNLSDSENEIDGQSQQNTAAVGPLTHSQFPLFPLSPSRRYGFPVSFDNLLQNSIVRRTLPQIDTTVEDISADFDSFSSTSPRVTTRAGANDSPATSISMLIHSSMETPRTTRKRQKTPFTRTQRLQEELYESQGEKPSNLLEENQLLYQTLDFERKRLILRKGLCAFTYGALLRQREKLEMAKSKLNVKSEECAARLIFHGLLLQAYRRVQEQLNGLVIENAQLQKSAENLCLQLRVVRHLQSAEKERVVEKIHEIGNLKTELTYVKKILGKTKGELEKVGQECEGLEKSNTEFAEEKYKMLREQRLTEEKMEMLQGSLEMEKKRNEKQSTALKELKRQVVDLRQQITELMKQSDDFNEKARTFEAKNWELQMLLEARGKEVIDLGQTRDSLKAEVNALEKLTLCLRSKNEDLELGIVEQEKVRNKLTENINGAEGHRRQQSARIGYLEDEIGRITQANLSMRDELSAYQLINTRRRRCWANLTSGMAVPESLGAIVSLFLGRPNDLFTL